MLAAPVGVDRAVEGDVGRIVARDDRARLLDDDLGRRAARSSSSKSQPSSKRLALDAARSARSGSRKSRARAAVPNRPGRPDRPCAGAPRRSPARRCGATRRRRRRGSFASFSRPSRNFPKLPLEGHRLNELSEEFVQEYENKTRTNQAHKGCAREACGASAASPTRRRDAEAGFFYAGCMISAVIRVDRGAEALAVTLSALVPAVADGLVGDAVVLSRTRIPQSQRWPMRSAPRSSPRPTPRSPKEAAAARRDWILCLADGDVPTEGWMRALDRSSP